jgi:hypothetical protein
MPVLLTRRLSAIVVATLVVLTLLATAYALRVQTASATTPPTFPERIHGGSQPMIQ